MDHQTHGERGLRTAPARDAEQREILSAEALRFLAALGQAFTGRVRELLARRVEAQARLVAGEPLCFLPETRAVREGEWRAAPLPADLWDRRVEITGPPERKMVINALNSGAQVFMADFEDSTAPTWDNLLHGQVNLRDAVRRVIAYRDPQSGKEYGLRPQIATLMVRPRGLHLWEEHVRLPATGAGMQDGGPLPAGLFDFGLFLFHNARALLQRGTGPYFYLPKLEDHQEARLWADVFRKSEELLALPQGCIRATVLIETLPAAFQMDEIIYELRDYAAGLNCGRWDYIFSFIKKRRHEPLAVLPDRAQVTMTQPFLRAYTQGLIKTCHRRGVHGMGGMAAQIPIRADAERNQQALAKVRADKDREAGDGHDGTWVAHPGLVAVAQAAFAARLPEGVVHQHAVRRDDVTLLASDLLRVPEGTRTEEGLRHNVRVGVQYLAAWLTGQGCVPLYDLMEDAATAEISRAQLWQWQRHGARLSDGRVVTPALLREVIAVEAAALPEGPQKEQALGLFTALCLAEEFPEFLTLPAYQLLLAGEAA